MNNNYLKKKKITCEEEDFAVEYVVINFFLRVLCVFFFFTRSNII